MLMMTPLSSGPLPLPPFFRYCTAEWHIVKVPTASISITVQIGTEGKQTTQNKRWLYTKVSDRRNSKIEQLLVKGKILDPRSLHWGPRPWYEKIEVVLLWHHIPAKSWGRPHSRKYKS